MVPRQQFINKIRELGYTHKDETKRVQIWRKQGATHFLTVKKGSTLEEGYVTIALRQAGLGEEAIKQFIACAKS